MTETKIDKQVKASELLSKGYTGDIRKDWCKGGRWSYDCDEVGIRYSRYRIGGKHFSKNCLGDYFSQRPAQTGSGELLSTSKQCTVILGGDFNASDIDWESHTVCEHSLNRQINEKIISVISSSGLAQIQKDFTKNDKILDLLCTNKPDLFSDIRSIPGTSDHDIILADCDMKSVVCKKPTQTIYLWNKLDWNKNRLLASEFSESFLPEHGTRSVEKNYTMFKEFIALTMKEHIPNKLTSNRTNLPWFNRGLKRMCKVKRRRFKRGKK